MYKRAESRQMFFFFYFGLADIENEIGGSATCRVGTSAISVTQSEG